MNAQQAVYAAVEARGYTAGWSSIQFLARQIAKLTEELAEAYDLIEYDADDPLAFDFDLELGRAGRAARRFFDERTAWDRTEVGPQDVDEFVASMRQELADCQVVLFCAAHALARFDGAPFDVVEEALKKATADVSRGVRGSG